MADRVALSQYCKAQATLNKLDKSTDGERKALNERIRTYRTLLHEQLASHNISCMEINRDNQEPIYVRLKQRTSTEPVTSKLIMDVFLKLDYLSLIHI